MPTSMAKGGRCRRASPLITIAIDFGMAREVFDPSGLLEYSVLAMGGIDDREVTLLDLEGWRSVTRGPFRLHRFRGGHFFLHEAQAEVVALLLESVRDRLPELGAP
jgi:medium-chain acyl-[acyl-carrier-protein] hydrolase